MSMRIFSLLPIAALACTSCAPEAGVPDGELVDCALAAGADLAADCILEDLAAESFAIHHPDGSFHRFSYFDGTGVLTVADGAEGIRVEQVGEAGVVQFGVGDVRYRVPLDLIGGKPSSGPASGSVSGSVSGPAPDSASDTAL